MTRWHLLAAWYWLWLVLAALAVSAILLAGLGILPVVHAPACRVHGVGGRDC